MLLKKRQTRWTNLKGVRFLFVLLLFLFTVIISVTAEATRVSWIKVPLVIQHGPRRWGTLQDARCQTSRSWRVRMRSEVFTGADRYYWTSTNGGMRMRTGVFTGALMAENVRSPFDYREPPTLDSDGDGGKPPPPRGLVKKNVIRVGNEALKLI